MEDNKQIKQQNEKIEEAVEKQEKAEEEIVEQEVEKVEKGKETVKQAEKEVAKEISKEADELKEEKEKIEEKVVKIEKKVEKKQEQVSSVSKKTQAVVNGKDLRISTKHAIAICNFIRNQGIDKAISKLEDVVKMKRPIPMKGEIPHRKGKIMSGRYPIKASEVFIRLLKSLKANAIANELELEKVKITCKANVAARPYRRFGQSRFKRSHVEIKLVELKKKINKEKRK